MSGRIVALALGAEQANRASHTNDPERPSARGLDHEEQTLMADPRLLVALAAEAAGLQTMLSDFLGRPDLAGVDLEDDVLHRANPKLKELQDTLADQAQQAANPADIVSQLGWDRPMRSDPPLATRPHDWTRP